ncbi:MAG TPA: LpxL/LpxP family Kdo(2)-lipid IV(A) lauroyl/palmitoleoyl acyltransferase [Gammaproteobacteria bacterium]|nr:LpxL/LpxP family Kdo(2)-lipid IV(A) lauroyl/palmitoleoyl acyltransferase [Gammaproteobacteria bacterium]
MVTPFTSRTIQVCFGPAALSQKKTRTAIPFPETLKPKYWPAWFGFLLLSSITRLPFAWQSAIGRQLGRLTYRVAKKRRKIAEINLQLCFPQLSPEARTQLLRQNFEYIGMAAIETGLSWWGPKQRLEALGKITGMEHLEQALTQGKGVILLTGHLTSLDIGGQILAAKLCDTDHPLQVMYKRSRNILVETMTKRGRERFTRRIFVRKDLRRFFRGLQENLPTWYAPDQDFGRHGNTVFAPFFGVSTATLTTTARLSKKTGAPIVPYFPIRLPNDQGYEIRLLPALENFPSNDDIEDARRINHLLEQIIQEYPAQYLWLHRRFKTRPEGEASVY